MATAKMKIILPLVVWIWLHTVTTVQSYDRIGHGKREIFFLNLEDGYFGCQVNESTDVLQLFELSKLCDGRPNCYLGSDEKGQELKCTDNCQKEDGSICQNGACLDGQCHCNDGYGGCNCEVPDENECKYRPCDVFAHCTNTLGSFSCTCYPGYQGDGFHCEDINECEDPNISARCVENAWCCNLPAHFLCKCNPGFRGDGEVQCTDIDECENPNACGQNAHCQNYPGNYTCSCPEGFYGNPYDGCVDVDECNQPDACGPGAHCSNVIGGRQCSCPPGYEGDPYTTGCVDIDECSRSNPCGRDALCSNQEGSFRCACPPGFIGDPLTGCTDIQCRSHSECSPQQACIGGKCNNPCLVSNPCQKSQDCQVQNHQPVCVKVCQCRKHTDCGRANYVCDGCNCVLHEEPGKTTGCEHCPPGVACDPTTGACIRDMGTAPPETLTETQTQATVTLVTQTPSITVELDKTASTVSSTEEFTQTSHSSTKSTSEFMEYSTPKESEYSYETSSMEVTQSTLSTKKSEETELVFPVTSTTEKYITVTSISNITVGGEESTQTASQFSSETGTKPMKAYRTDSTLRPTEDLTELTTPTTPKIEEYGFTPPVEGVLPEITLTTEKDTSITSESSSSRSTEDLTELTTPYDAKETGVTSRTVSPDTRTPKIEEYGFTPPIEGVLPEITLTTETDTSTTSESSISQSTLQTSSKTGQTDSETTYSISTQQPFIQNKTETPYAYMTIPVFVYTEPEWTTKIQTAKTSGTSEQPPTMSTNTNMEISTESKGQTYTSQTTEEMYAISNGSTIKSSTIGGMNETTIPNVPSTISTISPDEEYPTKSSLETVVSTLEGRSTSGEMESSSQEMISEEMSTFRSSTEESISSSESATYPAGTESYTTASKTSVELTEFTTAKSTSTLPPMPTSEFSSENFVSTTESETTSGSSTGKTISQEMTTPEATYSITESGTYTSATEEIVTMSPNLTSAISSTVGYPTTESTLETAYSTSFEVSSTQEEVTPSEARRTTESGSTLFGSPTKTVSGEMTTFGADSEAFTSVSPTTMEGSAVTTVLTGESSTEHLRTTAERGAHTAGTGTTEAISEGITESSASTEATQEIFSGPSTTETGTTIPKGPTAEFTTTYEESTMGAISAETTKEEGTTIHLFTSAMNQTEPTLSTTLEAERTTVSNETELYTSPMKVVFEATTPETDVSSEGMPFTSASLTEKPFASVTENPFTNSVFSTIHTTETIQIVEQRTDRTKSPKGITEGDQIRTTTETTALKTEESLSTSSTESSQETTAISTEMPFNESIPIISIGNYTESIQNETTFCREETDCNSDEVCVNDKCIRGCSFGHCAPNTLCTTENHQVSCECPPHFVGNATKMCFKEPGQPKVPKPCESDMDCLESEACYMSVCQDPCEFTNACAATAKCQAKMHRPICTCPKGYEGNPAVKCFKSDTIRCTVNEECPLTEACINYSCQRPCDLRNPCAHNAICINTNHGSDCSCAEGYQGNGYVGCVPVADYKPVCQYNEDCPPNKLCDRLNRICINPCFEDSCGDNAECLPKDHGTECRCLPGYAGNPFISCDKVYGCRQDEDCSSNEACINGQCSSPCQCGTNAICEVIYHRASCKCPPGYVGNPAVVCQPPSNPCEPNPCGTFALCELDNGNPICYCPKGLTGNPFKNCFPEGDDCSPNPCGPNSGCRVVGGKAVCFCLPEYEGTPPQIPCDLPKNPCDPSPCGPNTQCSILSNGFAKCTCLPGYLESPNTIRGCIEQKNPCEPNPCGLGAQCDPFREPACFCPVGLIGNPFRSCGEPVVTPMLCSPGPCGLNADCYVSNNQEQCYCKSGFMGDPYYGCRIEPPSPCSPNPCGPGAQCIVTPEGNSLCRCPDGLGGDPTGPGGCHGYECVVNENCGDHQACMGYRCRDPCPGACGVNADCRVEKHHPVCTCHHEYTGNPVINCFKVPIMPENDPCMPNPCGINTICQNVRGRAVCTCLPDFKGDPQFGCQPECILNTDCPMTQACLDRRCKDPCLIALCGVNAQCQVRDHTASCVCEEGYMGDPLYQCVRTPPVRIPSTNISTPCTPSPCGDGIECNVYGPQVAICDPCLRPDAAYNPQCRPECLTNSDCPFDKACLGNTCQDPCLGSCGVHAVCHEVTHTPICTCPPGLQGNPFEHCTVPMKPEDRTETCDGFMCGANAECTQKKNGVSCSCREGFFGNPWISCRPECVINTDCSLSQACINNKCVDPCNGVCGVGSKCEVSNHIPICICPPGQAGDPFVSCHPSKPIQPSGNPCDPSPCGPFSRCFLSPQGYATCSCLPNYLGSPPACKPECIATSECPQIKACVNRKCVDPCTGACGKDAVCNVINHNPICSCPPGQHGDPFVNCYTPRQPDIPRTNPCVPSPCGPNSICQVKEDRPVCSCVADYIGSPPNCRPECVINQECPRDKACVKEKCVNPCINSCGRNAKCNIVNHVPFCTCLEGYEGDAFIECSRIPMPMHKDPCNPSPCGINAQCTSSDGVARCNCIPPYIGNPYAGGCRPECTIDSDCSSNLACLAQHCRDPCQGRCGTNAECYVVNHVPVCSCAQGYIGDPFTSCRTAPPPIPENPCEPSPCGPNSICQPNNNRAICSCQPDFFGSPPNCKPECLLSSECALNKACINQKCVDPCPGTCGRNARCQVKNHNPICSCPPNYFGDPFVLCEKETREVPPMTPCVPSPCGPNSECRTNQNRAVCSCLPGMYGAPPNCRPECVINQDCPSHLACLNNKCKDPCVGSCGFNAQCIVRNHNPTCTCISGFEGDPFSGCNPIQIVPEPSHPCNPSPCGPNAVCKEHNNVGSCTCLPEYFGDPYTGCRPECLMSSDCSHNQACFNQKCKDPCPGSCGVDAECSVINHNPQCYCPNGYTGNALTFCRKFEPIEEPRRNPCTPSPCGPYSICRVQNDRPVCSCNVGYIGAPPACKPECLISAECSMDKACKNQQCIDPCLGTCGYNAHCKVIMHNPICSCPSGYNGDPFSRCYLQPKIPEVEQNPCIPSPCGAFSECRVQNERPVCSCLPNFYGRPPNCRPECTVSSECDPMKACQNQRCIDPCIGSCGANAECKAINHLPVCFCLPQFTGDPFVGCQELPPVEEERHPCNPSPCGANALCREQNGVGSCTCLPEYFGDPYAGCRPECVTNSDCTMDKACFNNKCRDPCSGSCGLNAECKVYNHAPNCYCLSGYTGNALVSCHVIQPIVEERDPCQPSPCGPFSECRVVNGHAVCSCQRNYIGSPPACRPECTVSSECSQDKACIGQKCRDPCPGTCSPNARCKVINHNPICSCPPNYTGDPFQLCVEERKPLPMPPSDACLPSPCGPNSQCRNINGRAVCSCLPEFIGRAPNCRPECTINTECAGNLACIREKCRDPCQGSCGSNSNCRVVQHSPVCQCNIGFTGDPFVGCTQQPILEEEPHPCNPSPCGSNAVCTERNGVGSCTCLPEYFGDPYTSCKPECVINNDCPRDKTCVNMKCKDPCPGTCGLNADCRVFNHAPSCYCIEGYTGNPTVACHIIQPVVEEKDPCQPSPCGPYSQCRVVNGHAVCSCDKNYIGSPPNCRPECMISADCPMELACINQKCQDPCKGTCGINSRCQVVNHNPICSCSPGFTGDPFVRCQQEDRKPPPPENVCVPSPCGPNARCREIGNIPTCSCLSGYIGRPPNCRPECTINAECSSSLACQNEKCIDPCPGSCGTNADCQVINHRSVCSCRQGYTGDPFGGCSPIPIVQPTEQPPNPCNPSPCGANAVCRERNGIGSCTCLPEYFGDPYTNCRPECVTNTDCPRNKACVNNKCIDPCPGTCGLNAECIVSNHAPVCNCLPGYTGNPHSSCHLPQPIVHDHVNPCQPSPCGPYSICKVINEHAVCSCQTNYIGSPPACRPECMVSSECPQDKACIKNKCQDPCVATCGINARCNTINHNPICTCPQGFVGDPFVQCIREITTTPRPSENPCIPSPCGQNSQCRNVAGQAACSCLPNYIGRSPNCRPECTINEECPNNLACQNERCVDPCPGSCGSFTNCIVVNHAPNCQCLSGFTGDPFTGCSQIPSSPTTERPRNPCDPSPCGANAICKVQGTAGSCTCLPEYTGDPYTGCRPECVTNTDCDRNKACVNNKCIDPCPGTCGVNAECRVFNHAPSCSCISGYTGDPARLCYVLKPERKPSFPCQPSPCGPYSQCRAINDQAVCSCSPGYVGTPPMCKPECIISSECPQNLACKNQKCVDPCPGTCGLNANCRAINHNPICGCLPGFTGDPFTSCSQIPQTTPPPRRIACEPSPCGPNSQCRIVGDQPACSCLPNYIGRPPNCRPECINDLECPNHLACKNEKCRDPCPGSCGNNAQCTVVNHKPVCSCLPGYIGDPISSCRIAPPPSTEGPPQSPCYPSPCGANAECRERNGAGACSCATGFFGNPYDKERGCHRECERSNDCAPQLACVNYKCIDPCPGTCGLLAQCSVTNHIPTCTCLEGFTGDPFSQCTEIRRKPEPMPKDPCSRSPCGPNSQCRNVNNQPVCSCLPNYIGSPPSCRPECVVSSECPEDRACTNNKCADPCPNTCGIGAQCTTKYHNPICACPPGYTGDPFTRCSPQPVEEEQTERPPSCQPSPCGPNSQCRMIGGNPSCSCLPEYIGMPPSCRPECVLSSECSSQLACIKQKCRDPCPGSCGVNAKCTILNHTPICTCEEGYEGDPFTLCSIKPAVTEPPRKSDPCNPSPCGPNARCDNGICTCLPEYQGNPYESCRPECVLSAECTRDKACIRNKCVDPCPGVCGQNAKCDVINHIPTCSCPDGLTGDPFTLCRAAPKPPERRDPCNPSPCGPNSQCRNINNNAVCSCISGYFGAPPNCKPECLVSAECAPTRSCINQKCIDPCLGSCGIGARCEVINHSPICSCPERQTGDPFSSCREIRIPPTPPPVVNPCEPSPCGPNSICRVIGDQATCSCVQGYIGNPPSCRPECIINPDCQANLACINNKCIDPCPGSCGENTVCKVIGHTVSCSCSPGYTGNPFVQCVVQAKDEKINPCEPSPCGTNAECKQQNGVGSCTCIQGYQGNPYESCKPECVLSSDCPTNKACSRNKCVDPCPGVCGINADCAVVNHIPTCTCATGYEGDPFRECRVPQPQPTSPTVFDPCQPSPCGPNSQCRNVNGQGVCSCLPEFTGSPPNCKPECVVSSECSPNQACHNFKCANPCAGSCGLGARCEVINHNPICSCPSGFTGDPFVRCREVPPEVKPRPNLNPCVPSPCGPNSECRVIGEQASCSCLANYQGPPPNCRPECIVNTDCPSTKACISEKCRDPCVGSCGFNAECRVQNHIPICTCIQGFVGDPFTQCQPKVVEPVVPEDPCSPNPCGPNAQCNNGLCTCLPLYNGDPYRGCRPECTMNTDCSPNKACSNSRCVDPCRGTCGQNADCSVINHIPSCSCPAGYEGDPFTACRPAIPVVTRNPCEPSPCGPNSVCRVNNEVAVCSCQPGLIGSPPSCRPECVVSAECQLQQACLNNKCIDPCPGTCGINAKCQVVNHNPICSCPSDLTGDPFSRCYPRPVEPQPPINPCMPSPCGPNAVCQVRGDSPACSCLENYVGVPPNCRPECTINPECPSDRSCINQKCRDPCAGSCGLNAVCNVVNHNPVCACVQGYTGDPFRGCSLQPEPTPPPKETNPCQPSPCGPNAVCRVVNNYAVCECIPEYRGNPYEACRPECLSNSDCTMNRACIRNKCQDPCPGTCGINAMCTVLNHVPICSCPDSFTGDAFRICTEVVVQPPRDPCNPSPCGMNTICRTLGENAVCECLPGFFGNPTSGGCRPECTISADCPRDKACVNTKCIDPCVGVCGFNAQCHVVNHSPICSCPQPLIGNPFELCVEQKEPIDPCNPSPCGPNGQCRVINGVASCSYPECIINQDCPRDKACYSQKCGDPCRDACGVNALCQVINHKAICRCPPEYVGSPEVECRLEPRVPQPKVECLQDSDCTNDKACIDNRCQDPCSVSLGVCGQNAECRPQLHRAICICRDGYTGNAQTACFDIGCRSNSDCPPIQACINRECIDPCSYTSCGLNALCKPDSNHRARCYCPENFKGDPFIRCERPECTNDNECPYNLACRNERCEDPCKCGLSAICSVNNHRPQCSCPPGYNGNPLVSCNLQPLVISECKMDADCPSKLACFSGKCKNPCTETKPCGINAECVVVDSLPLRTMSCICLPGYIGDADKECRLETEEGCKSHNDCAFTEACLNRRCVNPCAVGSPCAVTALCDPQNHKAVCRCPSGFIGNPFVKCYEGLVPKEECTTSLDCPSDKSCINQHCQDACLISNPCGTDAQCKTLQHHPACFCPDGWGGNPQVMCYKPECKSNDECPYNKACINENCLNPCSSLSCGRGAECIVQNHWAQCTCPAGTQGNPLISCIAGICQYNEDCGDHEACDRLNRVCRPVCQEDFCDDTAICEAQAHQAICTCPPGTEGNPYHQCVSGKTPPEPRPECKMDIDCPSQYACIEQRCLNPCLENNVCTPDQECRVLDTLPLRTIMCQCPPDTIADISGRCRAIVVVEPQCRVDSDCTDREKCISGNCVEACRIDLCGINALCNSQHHQAICSCSPGYTGNPHVECTVSRLPVPKPVPECYSDDECSYDKACLNERCINPCLRDRPCGIGAFCSVNNHKAVCTCPIGFEGSPHTECLPPLGPTVGCKSNSECAQTESCVNGICVNPCNCGPNAQCNIVNHYPMCYCKPGYSGNPQLGCIKLGCQSDNECNNDQQCYNGQCVDPCILGDPCATSAICYGNNHIASCKCPPGYEGNPFDRCERIECHTDSECPNNRACIQKHCIDPCSTIANPPCAHNAICYAQNHVAGCQCPPHLPQGNPLAYCTAPVIIGKECELDLDCPSQLACIKEKCVNPCKTLSPCHNTAHCSVLDTIPVRTMICTCPEGWVPNENGECHAVVVPIPPGCTSDNDCSTSEACINRRCRNPCDCGSNANCLVQNHRPVCSCLNGFEGNPNIACYAVGCRIDSECESGKACVNGNCINPCLVEDPCGVNAECYVYQNRAQCRCLSGYRGNPFERCNIVGCISNSDCPGDRQCRNTQCVDPCIYDSPCSPRAECLVHNHIALCRCRYGFIGNPYVDCKPEPQPECREDVECPSRLACLNNKCQDPCVVLEPCHRPSECIVVGSVPVRTMICVCPPGYISSGSGTCHPVTAIQVGACVVDEECPVDKSCINGICRDPCNCGLNAECRIKNHKPVCTCKQGYDGNPEIECERTGCRNDEQCSGQHICVNRQCVPVCAADGTSCGKDAVCYGVNHHAVCDCPPGFIGNPEISCVLIGCRSDTECPNGRACVNNKCDNPCNTSNPCAAPAECKVYNHMVECVCPPGTISDGKTGCIEVGIEKCRKDHDCPSQYACIGGECINPCKETDPCGVNADCTVLDTEPVRTMICKCMPGYEGNAAVQCDKTAICRTDKGFIRTPDGKCVCPPNTALDENDECILCPVQNGFKIDEKGRCVCALERGFIIDDRGNCVCPVNGYHLDARGNCIKRFGPKCETDDDCLDQEFCESTTKTCQDPCLYKTCAENAFCNATNHVAVCKCRVGFTGDPEVYCNQTSPLRTVFPRPEMVVSCLSDGVQVEIHIAETEFNGVFYVKGHSKDEQCRRIVTLPSNSLPRTEIFKVQFGNCGLIHVNGQASFVLVIQKHPKLVTYKAQAYHIKCVYQTGEQNVTLGFNVSMLTTAGTIANTGPPPVCTMKIVTPTGKEINSAEIGDNLMLQVEVQPGSIYGGFARSCVAKTMEANVENEYPVTDENGCATDPTIFGEWDYDPDTQSLSASFNAFKFPSSDNIRFQCNIRVCFGACQPVNCRGYNAFGRRKRSVENENTDLAVSGDLMTGQLREEITISSNAILTFERREEKLVDPAAAADYQRVEDICVSMIGFIISLVITALLALVAIAVAVSCWLMAYRRRPKASGPLPHPPEFPNPLFTTPEPMAEPSPDYLT